MKTIDSEIIGKHCLIYVNKMCIEVPEEYYREYVGTCFYINSRNHYNLDMQESIQIDLGSFPNNPDRSVWSIDIVLNTQDWAYYIEDVSKINNDRAERIIKKMLPAIIKFLTDTYECTLLN